MPRSIRSRDRWANIHGIININNTYTLDVPTYSTQTMILHTDIMIAIQGPRVAEQHLLHAEFAHLRSGGLEAVTENVWRYHV